MKAVIVGQGYVGLPVAMRAVEVGHRVVGFENDANRAQRLAAGDSYVEDISDETLAAALASERYLPTNDPRHCGGFDVAVITVPTPLREGAPDLSYIEQASTTLARFVRPGATVILESTTYPGTTEELVGTLLEEGSGLKAGIDFNLGYSPERIDPGNATWGFTNTPKVVSGVNETSLAAVREFYESLVDEVVPVSGTREAELVKLLENTFRHVNVALVNELAMFAGGSRDRHLGGHRRGFHQALRLHAVRAGPGCGRALPPHRPELPVVAGQERAGSELPVRRAGQRRERAHARLRRTSCPGVAERGAQGHQRQPHPPPGLGLQAQHE